MKYLLVCRECFRIPLQWVRTPQSGERVKTCMFDNLSMAGLFNTWFCLRGLGVRDTSIHLTSILQMRKLRNEPNSLSFCSPCRDFSLTVTPGGNHTSECPHLHSQLVSFCPSGRAESGCLAQEQSLGWHQLPWCHLPAVTVQCVTYPITHGSTGWSRRGGNICKSHVFPFNLYNTVPKEILLSAFQVYQNWISDYVLISY